MLEHLVEAQRVVGSSPSCATIRGSMIESPCIKECIFNYEEDYCTGCYRRLDDIFDWSKKTDQEKKRIIQRAKKLKKEKERLGK